MCEDYYNSWLKDELLSLRANIDIILALYADRTKHNLIPTALEDFIEKSQKLIDYTIEKPEENGYITPGNTYITPDNYTRDVTPYYNTPYDDNYYTTPYNGYVTADTPWIYSP